MRQRVQGGGGTEAEKAAVGRQFGGRPSTSTSKKGVCLTCRREGEIGQTCQPRVKGERAWDVHGPVN